MKVVKLLISLVLIVLLSVMLCGCKKERSSRSSSAPPFSTGDPRYIPPDQRWSKTTPAGINIVTEKSVLDQYKLRWSSEGFSWENIDWEALDEEFFMAKDYYCNYIGWNCKGVEPYHLTIRIMPWADLSVCYDAETPDRPYEIYVYINGAWQCVDGWEWHGTIYTHLGDDPGQDHDLILSEEPLSYQEFRAWQETSVPHELMHFFQYMSGLPYSETPPDPPAHSFTTTLILPETKEPEDGQCPEGYELKDDGLCYEEEK